jgi:carboxymethylenebutenolidase
MISLSIPGGGAMPAYLALPQAPRGPAIVVLQEIFGVNANIRSITDDYARRGYVAIAPDLFWRQQAGIDLDPSNPAARESAMALMKNFDQANGAEDALVAASHVRRLPGASGRVGAVGYCLGGKLAYFLSMRPGVDAVVAYYGTGIHTELSRSAEIRNPLLLHIAKEDNLCPPEAQAAILTTFVHSECVTVIEHPKVGHAFARVGSPAFDAAAAHRANGATAEFFKLRLDGFS